MSSLQGEAGEASLSSRGGSKNPSVLLTCSYEPELFPGLIYRMVKPRIVLLIFVSGKVVLTGTVALSHSGSCCLSVLPHLYDLSLGFPHCGTFKIKARDWVQAFSGFHGNSCHSDTLVC